MRTIRTRRGPVVLAAVAMILGLTILLPPNVATAAQIAYEGMPSSSAVTPARTAVTRLLGGYVSTFSSAATGSIQVFSMRPGGSLSVSPDAVVGTDPVTKRSVRTGGIDFVDTNTGRYPTTLTNAPSWATIEKAMGAPPEIVADMAKQGDESAVTAKISTVAASYWALYTRWCTHTVYFDDHLGYYSGCFDQYVHKHTSTDWYMLDKFHVSATMHDCDVSHNGDHSPFCDEITGVKQWVTYPAHNFIDDWSPRASVPGFNNCPEIKWQLLGFQTVVFQCDEFQGFEDQTDYTFATKWNGGGYGPTWGTRDTGGMDHVHNPANASPTEGKHIRYWYE